jgi:hypothetical protein
VDARAKISARSESGLPRFHLGFRRRDPRGTIDHPRHARQEDAAEIGRVEVRSSRRKQSRWLAFNRRSSTTSRCRRRSGRRCSDADNKLKPNGRKQWVSLYRAIDPDICLHVLQLHDAVVGGLRRRRSRCAGRSSWATTWTERSRHPQIPGGGRRDADSRGRRRPRPTYRSINRYDPALANKLLDSLRLAKGKGRLPGRLPDGTRWCCASPRQHGDRSRVRTSCGRSRWTRSASDRLRTSAKFADNLKAAKACKLMMWSALDRRLPRRRQLHAAPLRPEQRAKQQRLLRIQAFDAFYQKSSQMPNSPERDFLFPRDDAPDGSRRRWSLHVSRESNQLLRPVG